MRHRLRASVRVLALVTFALVLPVGARAQASVPAAASPAGYVAATGVATFDSAWGIIHRRHFDTTFGGLDWRAVRDSLRPRAEAARDEQELRAVIRGMIARLRLSHYALLSAEAAGSYARQADTTAGARPGTTGMDVRTVDGTILVRDVEPEGPAARAGIRAGWELLSVDTVDTRAIAAARPAGLEPRYAAYRAAATASGLLLGRPGSPVRLTLRDASGRTVLKSLVREPQSGTPVTFGHLPTMYVRFDSRIVPAGPARVGVVRFNVWMTAVMPQLDRAMDSLRTTDGIVFDLRGNPGGVAGMVMGAAGHLMDSVAVLGVMTNRAGTLRFVSNPRRANAKGERVTPFAGPVAILVDESSASTSEFFAAGLQELGRARVFGMRTSGQALPAQLTRLPNGDVLYHAVADFTTAKGARLEKDGVRPDEELPLTRADLLAGRDAPMDAALRWISSQPRR